MDTIDEEVIAQLSQFNYTQEQIMNSKVEHLGNGRYGINVPIPTRKFITDVLITELLEVAKISPWLGVISLCSGIEFLGKCIDPENPMDWDVKGRSPKDFHNAINQLNGLKRYSYLLERVECDLYSELRCGLTHSLSPKNKISLSSGSDQNKNLSEAGGKVNINISDLYIDFKLACEDVINREFLEPNKMNRAKAFINHIVKYDPTPQSVRF